MEKVDVLIYKHVAENIEAIVNPETLELVSLIVLIKTIVTCHEELVLGSNLRNAGALALNF